MSGRSILSAEFVAELKTVGVRARQSALASGHPVVFVDEAGRTVEERPDGRLFEIRLDPARSGESHRVVLRELVTHAA